MRPLPINRPAVFLAVAASGAAIDLTTKHVVFERLGGLGRSSGLLMEGWVSFQLFTSLNEGALWGVGQGLSWLFAGLSIAAAAGIVYWLFFRGAAQSWWLTVCLGSIMAGTLGNLYDRLGLHGLTDPHGNQLYAVRDFLLFTFGTYHYPVFNFADAFLVTGAIMLVLHSFRAEARTAVAPVTNGAGGQKSARPQAELQVAATSPAP